MIRCVNALVSLINVGFLGVFQVKNSPRVIECKSQLLQAALSRCRLIDLLKLGEDLLGKPIVLSTENHLVWYASADIPENSIMPQTGGRIISIHDYELNLNIDANFMSLDNPTSFYDETEGYFYSLYAIRNGENIRGYSCAMSVDEFSDDDLAIQKAFCAVLGNEMGKQ